MGWSTRFYPQAELDAMEPEEARALCVTDASNIKFADATDGVIKFYAVYTIHSYTFTYNYADGTLIESIRVPAGRYVDVPAELPWKDDSELAPAETWKFVGYARTPNASESEVIASKEDDATKLNILSNSDLTLYAIFGADPVSVYENIHPEYFSGISYDYHGVMSVELSLIVKPRGKLTIPATFNGMPVAIVNSTFNGTTNGTNLTHIFFEKNGDGIANIRSIKASAFKDC